MIVPDTSAWVEFLRATGSAVHRALRSLLEERADLAVTEPVIMELLAGARSAREARELRERLLSFPILAQRGLADYEEAALIYRTCRAAGTAVGGLIDCLIAVPVIREGAELLHDDADFETISRHSRLRLYAIPER